MPPTTIDLRTPAIPTPQQRRRPGPIIRTTPLIKSLRLPNPQGMRDLVQRRALVHVAPVGAEADVAVEVAVCGLDGGDVLHRDGFAGAGGQAVVARHGGVHGGFDAPVGVGLVGCGVLGALELPGDGGGAEGGEDTEEEEEDAHGDGRSWWEDWER